jgi:protein phosphatase
MTETTIAVGAATDVGRRRDHNEDAYATFEAGGGEAEAGVGEAGPRKIEGGALVLVVADGMGGHQAGEVASEIAITVLRRELSQASAWADDPSGALKAAIERANQEIWHEAEADPEKSGMGSTIVAALVVGNRAYLANAGDSPAYLIRGQDSEQITRDHGLVAEQVEAGVIAPEDAEHHPFRHILTRCLGAEATVEAEVYPPRELQAGDVLVLCSDGLTEHVKQREVALLVASESPDSISPDKVAAALIDVANQRGGHDNITVVVARVS